MKLKELVDNIPFGEISKELRRTLHSAGRPYDKEREMIFKHLVETLKSLTPVRNEDCRIWAGRLDVSGLYSEEKRRELGIDTLLVSLVITPWEEWLGMDIDPDLMATAKPAAIVAGCLWEMTFYGYDKDEWERNVKRKFGNENNEEMTPSLPEEATAPRRMKWRRWKGTACIKDGTTEIPDRCFMGKANITDVRIPKTVKRIGSEAFKGCPPVSIDIPEGVTAIGERAFANCNGLEEVSLPASLQDIGEMAFYSCSRLKSIALPDGLRRIKAWAFSHAGLESVELPGTLECVISSAFEKCPVSSIRIPAGRTELAGWPFRGCPLKSITVDKDNKVYDSREECNALVETETDSIVATCESSTMPASTREILDWAFAKNKKATDVVIPDSVEEIGWFAFEECPNLTSVTIPASVRMIWPGAFSECPNLKTITVPKGASDHYRKMLWKELHSLVVENDTPSSPAHTA